MIKNCLKVISFLKHNITNGNNAEHNLRCPEISDHPDWMLKIEGPGSGKINALVNLINKHDRYKSFMIYIIRSTGFTWT